MAADGRVEISVNLDNKEAEKKLSDLRRSIERTAKSIESTGGKRAAITEQLEQARKEAAATAKEIEELNAQKIENEATLSGRTGDVSLEEFEARKQAQTEITYQLKEQEKLQASQNSNIAKLEEKERALTAQIEQQTASLEKQKSEAGEVERVIASQASSAMPQLAASAEAVSKSMRKGFKSILKWGFGIRSAFILMRLLRSAVIEGVKAFAQQDEETRNNINGLKSSLSTLKASWGAAFAPILNAVAPILQKLISLLVTAANYVQMFFSVLRGGVSYKKVIANNDALAKSYGGAGSAAKEAKKQLMSFDEINKLDSNDSGGGGGGGGGGSSAYDFVEEQIDNDSFVSRLALRFKDVFFEWDDLNPEQIASKFLTFIYGLSGAIIGFELGGPLGALVGTLAGLTIGLFASTVTFDGDGKINENEFLSILKMALGGIAGAVLAISLGAGLTGTVVAITLGISLALVLDHIQTNPLKGKGQAAIQEYIDEIDTTFKDAKPGTYQYMYYQHQRSVAEKEMRRAGKAGADGMAEGVEEEFTVLGWLEKTWEHIKENVRTSFGIHSPSTWFTDIGRNIVQGLANGISDKWTSLMTTIQGFWNRLKGWWDGLRLTPFYIPAPHFSWTYSQARGLIAKALEFVGLPATIPHLNIAWYAKGGIVDGTTLFGAGEAGREAVVPLERHTEWISMVADGIIDRITSNNRLADYISGMPLPALVTGGVVPPRALSGGGSVFSDGDIDRLVRGITAAFTQDGGEQIIIKTYLDGKQVAESVTRHQRRMERGFA